MAVPRQAERRPEKLVDRFRMYRSWVEEAIEALLNAGALTPDGERFVNGMRATVEAWADDR